MDGIKAVRTEIDEKSVYVTRVEVYGPKKHNIVIVTDNETKANRLESDRRATPVLECNFMRQTIWRPLCACVEKSLCLRKH